jgi:site-specific DNA-methyltransferase (adenine-specific)
MGHQWDAWVPGPELWTEVYRVLRPGAYCAVFAGNRTADVMATALRLSGFNLIDTVLYCYGTGMPKGADPSKQIDKKLGHQRKRDVIPQKRSGLHGDRPWMRDDDYRMESDIPVSEEAAQFHGMRTLLKPAYEPILIAQKPISEPTIAANLMRWGCGAMWIDRCRVERERVKAHVRVHKDTRRTSYGIGLRGSVQIGFHSKGGYPSNLIHDGSDAVAELLPETALELFYTSKATPGEKDLGLSNFYWRRDDNAAIGWTEIDAAEYAALPDSQRHHGNIHPTPKPLNLMRYLCRLFADKGQNILDPFAGSGTTLLAAVQEGMNVVGMEVVPEYAAMADARAAYIAPDTALDSMLAPAARETRQQCALGV